MEKNYDKSYVPSESESDIDISRWAHLYKYM